METRKIWAPIAFVMAVMLLVTVLIPATPLGSIAKAASNSDFVIVIDPGHGYKDGKTDSGAVAPDGTKESTLSLSLAYKIATQLKNKGYTVYSTLPVGGDIPNLMTGPNISQKGRAEAANSVRANLFISVHHNSTGNGSFNSACGTMVLYDGLQNASGMRAASENLARKVYNSVASLGYTKGNRSQPVVNQGADVLRYNNAPSITLEAGFLTNQDELTRLKDGNYQQAMAVKVADGVDSYIASYNDNEAPTGGPVLNSGTPTNVNTFAVEVFNVIDKSPIASVRFAVWNRNKPQAETLQWFEASDCGNNKWGANISLASFGNIEGTYDVEVYASDIMGNRECIGKTAVTYSNDQVPPTGGPVLNSGSPTAINTFAVEAYNVVDDRSGISRVQFAVWFRDKPQAETLQWFEAGDCGNNKWGANISLDSFGNIEGIYDVEVYATDGVGNRGYIGRTAVEYQSTKDTQGPTGGPVLNSGTPTTVNTFAVEAYNVTDPSGVSKVEFAVWDRYKPQAQTLQWVQAGNLGNNKWGANISLNSFGNVPSVYDVEVYAYDGVGNKECIGKTAVEYQKDTQGPTGGPVLNSGTPTTANTFAVEAYNVTDPSGVSKVEFAVWYRNLPKAQTLQWVQASNLGNNKWGANIDVRKFGSYLGVYDVEVYAYDGVGNKECVGKTAVDVQYHDPSQYDIKGASSVTAQQLYNYYVKKVGAASYPYDYTGINLLQFCELYVQDAQRYGIKPEVAFAQMVHETNFLKFTGDVKVGQFNFAGLGATGGGNPGNSFATVQEGIRAHIQHLYCYACKDAVPYGDQIVDPRWNYVTRGSAPTVELLSLRWATSVAYGEKVMGHVNGILACPTTMTATFGMDILDAPAINELPTQEPMPESSVIPESGVEPTPEPSAEPTPEPSPTSTVSPEVETGRSIIKEASAADKQKMLEVYRDEISLRNRSEEGGKYDIDGFPTKYGITLEQLVNLYYDEASIEGVDPKVAFAQAMIETDFFEKDTYNVGGFAEDGFSNIETAVRAQVQHLKCYASDNQCINSVVDPEWSDDIRKKADTVEKLQGTWSSTKGYAQNILKILEKMN